MRTRLRGKLRASDLLAIVHGLSGVAARLGRTSTDAEDVGRAPRRAHRVGDLTIGMQPGSTTVVARRAATDLTLDLEVGTSASSTSDSAIWVEAIGRDERPDWVDAPLARAAGALAGALKAAAPEVDFAIDGSRRRLFRTAAVTPETWAVGTAASGERTRFVGRLYAVNLLSHRLQVHDDAGNLVALPDVRDDAQIAPLIGRYVDVTGVAQRDASGRLTRLHEATVVAAVDPLSAATVPAVASLEDILASASGPDLDGGLDLTKDEFAAFLAAIHSG